MPTSPDTAEEARQLQLAAIRSMVPTHRVQAAVEMSELAAQISAAGASHRAEAQRR